MIEHKFVHVHPEVATALTDGKPVVALESTLLSHGLPLPHNIETAQACAQAVRDQDATPATIAVINGQLKVGIDTNDLATLTAGGDIAKLSRSDLPLCMAAGKTGATTVAATMLAAAHTGIKVFATGGIGGVHLGAKNTFDISADLTELARTDMVVVCSGVKKILDVAKTREMLETFGIPIIGYRTDWLPGFWTTATELRVDQRIDQASAINDILAARTTLGVHGGILVGNPVPADKAIEAAVIDELIHQAHAAALADNIHGKELTPYMLAKISALSGATTMDTNIALIVNNAKLAGEIASCICS